MHSLPLIALLGQGKKYKECKSKVPRLELLATRGSNPSRRGHPFVWITSPPSDARFSVPHVIFSVAAAAFISVAGRLPFDNAARRNRLASSSFEALAVSPSAAFISSIAVPSSSCSQTMRVASMSGCSSKGSRPQGRLGAPLHPLIQGACGRRRRIKPFPTSAMKKAATYPAGNSCKTQQIPCSSR
jgi:hypothetical protein